VNWARGAAAGSVDSFTHKPSLIGAGQRDSGNGEGWKGAAYLVLFWVLTIVGLPLLAGAWFLLPMASLVELTEQGKAAAAGTTMAGTTFLFGVLSLLAAHLVGILVLCSVGANGHHSRRTGLLVGLIAVAATSTVGLVVTLVISRGQPIATLHYVP
jgi:hypothetical protein